MSTFTDNSIYQYTLSGGFGLVKMQVPNRKGTPIRLYVTGATDPGGVASGVGEYFFTIRKSKVVDSGVELLQPSGIVALDKTGAIYKQFTSGYEPAVFARIDVEHAGYYTSTAIAATYSGTTYPATGLIYPSGDFSYSSNYVYLYEFWDWEPGLYYWFYVGAADKAGNKTRFSSMRAHSLNPWYGNHPVSGILIPQEDTVAPSGMLFFV
ncbi:MAG: hypothetical protein ACP5N7_05470 [Candidatus Pacearchaeota archaeon]